MALVIAWNIWGQRRCQRTRFLSQLVHCAGILDESINSPRDDILLDHATVLRADDLSADTGHHLHHIDHGHGET